MQNLFFLFFRGRSNVDNEWNLISSAKSLERQRKKNIQFPHKVDWPKCCDDGDPESVPSVI